jgi:hypothetical protein
MLTIVTGIHPDHAQYHHSRELLKVPNLEDKECLFVTLHELGHVYFKHVRYTWSNVDTVMSQELEAYAYAERCLVPDATFYANMFDALRTYTRHYKRNFGSCSWTSPVIWRTFQNCRKLLETRIKFHNCFVNDIT